MSDQTQTDPPVSRQVYWKQDDGLLVTANLSTDAATPPGATEITAEEYAYELAVAAAAQSDAIAAQRAALEGP